MKVERGLRRVLGSCNFCDKSQMTPTGTDLNYPYKMVSTLQNERGGGLKVSICDECVEELHAKVKMAML